MTAPLPAEGATGGGDGRALAGYLPRNYLRAAILVLLAEAPDHGYHLIEHLAELGVVNVDRAQLYRTLRALETEGLVDSFWERSMAGSARRTYQLTQAGATHLRFLGVTIRSTHSCLGRFLGRFDGLDGHR